MLHFTFGKQHHFCCYFDIAFLVQMATGVWKLLGISRKFVISTVYWWFQVTTIVQIDYLRILQYFSKVIMIWELKLKCYWSAAIWLGILLSVFSNSDDFDILQYMNSYRSANMATCSGSKSYTRPSPHHFLSLPSPAGERPACGGHGCERPRGSLLCGWRDTESEWHK